MSLSATLTNLAKRFAWMVVSLCKEIGLETQRRRAGGPLSLAAWIRVRKLAQRFAALLARVQAGTLRPLGQRRPAAPRPAGTPRSTGGLPRGFRLHDLLPESAGSAAGGLIDLLQTPGMADLIAAAPVRAARILRPLCRLLSIDLVPGTLRLVPLPRQRRPRPIAPPPPLPPTDPVAAYYSRPGGLVLNPHYPRDGRSRLVWS